MRSDQALVRLDESARFSMTIQISTLLRHRELLHCFHYQSGSCFCSCLLLLYAAFCDFFGQKCEKTRCIFINECR
ncbi:hypothetical protein OROMI_026281 [Orobanche minor]